MSAGHLKHRVELINIGWADDGAGGQTRTDTVEATVWGNLSPASASLQFRAERLEQRVSHTIRLRWREDFARGFGPHARARVTDAGGRTREFSVRTVLDPDERRRWLELQCLEGGPT